MSTKKRLYSFTANGGKIDGEVYCHNQYGPYISSPLWTREQWLGWKGGAILITTALAFTWSEMSEDEKNSWATRARKHKYSLFCAFVKYNYTRLKNGLEVKRTPK